MKFPLGVFICVTGVSGSGKSTLVTEILLKGLMRRLYGTGDKPGKHKNILGLSRVDKVIEIDQSPIGRTPRSNPATYTGVFDLIRQLFAMTREAKIRGYKAGRFSFNVKGGRCEHCQGQGTKCIEMHFLPDVYVVCQQCKGTRYNPETLEITYKGKNIADVLDMRIEEAREFFANFPKIVQLLQALCDVGLGVHDAGAVVARRCRAARPSGSSWPPSWAGRAPGTRCTCSTSRRRACTLPTSTTCSMCSSGCATWATR